MKIKQIFFLMLAFTTLIIPLCDGTPIVIKTAVVMPEKSTWTNTLYEMTREIKTKTKGAVTFKIYAGGISGDEANVIRKMRSNRIHAGGFSGIGLGLIVPDIRILESVLLFQNNKEIDYVKEQLFKTFQKKFEKKGYVLLGFFDGGAAYIFSKKSIKDVSSLQNIKMWIWKGDKIADQFFNDVRVNRYPLPITEVITGLETGMVNGFYSPPLAAVSLQWYSRVRYLLDYPLVNSVGAFLISKKTFDRLSEENKVIVALSVRRFCKKLVQLTREENEASMSVLKNSGIELVTPTKNQITLFQEGAQKSLKKNVSGIYSKELLDRINLLLKQFREKK